MKQGKKLEVMVERVFGRGKPLIQIILYTLLNIPLYYYYVAPFGEHVSNNIQLLTLFVSILLFTLGSVSVNPYLILSSYVLISIIASVYGYSIDYLYLLVCFIWVFVSEYLVILITEHIRGVAIRLNFKSIVGTALVSTIVILLATVIAIAITSVVLGFYDWIVVNTHPVFRSIYEDFISTRIGAAILLVFTLYATYYVLEHYFYNVMSDIVGISPAYARAKIREAIVEDAENCLNASDEFFKLMYRSVLFVILFYTYNFITPVVVIATNWIQDRVFKEVLYIALWLLASTIVYSVIKRRIRSAFVVSSVRFSLRVSYLPVIVSLVLLIVYTGILVVFNGVDDTLCIYGRALGVTHCVYDSSTQVVVLENQIISWLNGLPAYTRNYFERVVNTYNGLALLLKQLFEFLWGW
ncbi:MAG: hypothetical protein ABWW65_07915 [Thermoprotei archaeon]